MSYLLGEFLSENGLKHIKNHKFRSGGSAWIDKVLSPYWEFIARMMPGFMTPNLITFMGVLCLVISLGTMLYFDMSLTEPLPQWVYLLSGSGVYWYYTLDAVDGKYARLRGMSSPLGQLFDHGCDSLNITLCSLTVVSTLQLGLSFKAIIVIFCFSGRFFCSNFLEHHSGIYVYAVGSINTTNGGFLLSFINFLPGIFGNDFYTRNADEVLPLLPKLLTKGSVMGDWAFALVVAFSFIYISLLLFRIFTTIPTLKRMAKACIQFSQHLAVYVIMYAFNGKIPFMQKRAGLALLMPVMAYSLMTIKLILSNISKMSFPLFHYELLVFLPFLYVQSQVDGSEEREREVEKCFWITFAFMGTLYAKFLHTCIKQLTLYLGFPLFGVPKALK